MSHQRRKQVGEVIATGLKEQTRVTGPVGRAISSMMMKENFNKSSQILVDMAYMVADFICSRGRYPTMEEAEQHHRMHIENHHKKTIGMETYKRKLSTPIELFKHCPWYPKFCKIQISNANPELYRGYMTIANSLQKDGDPKNVIKMKRYVTGKVTDVDQPMTKHITNVIQSGKNLNVTDYGGGDGHKANRIFPQSKIEVVEKGQELGNSECDVVLAVNVLNQKDTEDPKSIIDIARAKAAIIVLPTDKSKDGSSSVKRTTRQDNWAPYDCPERKAMIKQLKELHQAHPIRDGENLVIFDMKQIFFETPDTIVTNDFEAISSKMSKIPIKSIGPSIMPLMCVNNFDLRTIVGATRKYDGTLHHVICRKGKYKIYPRTYDFHPNRVNIYAEGKYDGPEYAFDIEIMTSRRFHVVRVHTFVSMDTSSTVQMCSLLERNIISGNLGIDACFGGGRGKARCQCEYDGAVIHTAEGVQYYLKDQTTYDVIKNHDDAGGTFFSTCYMDNGNLIELEQRYSKEKKMFHKEGLKTSNVGSFPPSFLGLSLATAKRSYPCPKTLQGHEEANATGGVPIDDTITDAEIEELRG